MKYQLVLPMAFYAFYIFGLAFFLFRTRLKAMKTGEVSPKYFKSYTGEGPSDRTILIGRHYDNQFQVPILFFFACTVLISLNAADTMAVVFAWLFIMARVVHSFVHLGKNKLEHRALSFTASWIFVLVLWAKLIYIALQ